MIIQCPACHARARISDSQEGAKVRCGECSRIFVAGATAGRSRSSSSGSKLGLWLGMGAGGIGLLFVAIMLSQGQGTDFEKNAKEPEEDPVVESTADSTSFEGSPEIQAAVRVHDAAFRQQEIQVRAAMYGPRVYAWKKSLEAMAAGPAEGETEVAITDEQRAAWVAEFEALPSFRQSETLQEYSSSICSGDDRDLVANWAPYDGSIVESNDSTGEARIQLLVSSREEGSFETRTIEWTLFNDHGRWMVCSWERWFSEAEKHALRVRRSKGYEKVTLSDGSTVHERDPEPLGHLEDTPAELRTRIDSLIATMIDLELTREATKARNDLIEIGKPAIPRLLTKLYEIPLDTEDQSIQVNQVVTALRGITDQYFGYEPSEIVGSAAGTTKERRDSSIRQWFAWWYRKQDKFTEADSTDALEEKIQLTEKEKEWLKRNSDQD